MRIGLVKCLEGDPLECLSDVILEPFLPSYALKRQSVAAQTLEFQHMCFLSTGPRHWGAALNREELYLPSWNLHLDKVIVC